MFQYFLKVVSTQFRTLDSKVVSRLHISINQVFPSLDLDLQVNSNQYSATQFERDLTEGFHGGMDHGVSLQHGVQGQPGAFFNFEISPILVVHAETRQSFAHFITSYVSWSYYLLCTY